MPLLTLLLLFLLPGYVCWLAFGNVLRGRLTAVEVLFLILLTSVVVVTWPALVLAELGFFSLPLLMGIVVIGSLLVGVGGMWRNGRFIFNPFHNTTFTLTDLLPFVLIALAVGLSPRAFEYINGGRDHGVYVNTGIHIARSGSILFADPELAAVPPESRALLTNPLVAPFHTLVPGPWSEGQRLPGLTIRDVEQGVLTPHAFHLYPVWIAIFQAVGSVRWALWTTAVFNCLGLLAIYVTAARLLSKPVALFTLLLLVLNVSQVWYTHYPSAEILVRFFFWSGLYGFILMLSSGGGYTAVLAALAFGYLHLTKLDTFFVPIILFIVLGTLWLRQKWRKSYTHFVVTYGLICLHAALHAFFIATIYFLDQLLRVLLPGFLTRPIITAIGEATYPVAILQKVIGRFALHILLSLLLLIGILWLLHRYRAPITSNLAPLSILKQSGRVAIALALALLTVTATFLPTNGPLPFLDTPATTFTMLGWYLSLLGLLLGMAGLGHFVLVSQELSHHFTWLFLIGNTLPLLLLGASTFPDQFWAIRRFVPVVLPTFILFAAYFIWHFLPQLHRLWGNLLAVGLSLALLIFSWQTTQPVIGAAEYNGLITQVQHLHESFPPEAVLLFAASDAANRVTLPLWTLFDRTVFRLQPEALADEGLATAVHQWQAQNRAVYWLASGSEPPLDTPDLFLTYLRTENLEVPLIEARTDGVPRRFGRFLAAFDIYQFIPEADPVSQVALTLPIAWGTDDASLSGLYEPEYLPGLTPRRWTSGQVILHFETTDRPSQLLLRMANGRPPDIPPAEVTIFAGDMPLDRVVVQGESQVYSISIPEAVPFVGETAEFRLQMTPWIPAQTGYNADQRELGVYLDWAKLIVTEEKLAR